MTDDALPRAETVHACAELAENCETIAFAAVSHRVGLGRTTLYQQPELRTALEAVADKVRRHEESLCCLTRRDRTDLRPSLIPDQPDNQKVSDRLSRSCSIRSFAYSVSSSRSLARSAVVSPSRLRVPPVDTVLADPAAQSGVVDTRVAGDLGDRLPDVRTSLTASRLTCR
ncbi:MAG: hypothetical protein ACRDYA_04490 [Egibacteraceae bacterium]